MAKILKICRRFWWRGLVDSRDFCIENEWLMAAYISHALQMAPINISSLAPLTLLLCLSVYVYVWNIMQTYTGPVGVVRNVCVYVFCGPFVSKSDLLSRPVTSLSSALERIQD